MSAFTDSPTEFIAQFVREQAGAVIATLPAQDGHPESAWVNVGVTDSGLIVFGTSRASRKAANLQADPRVSLVVVDGQQHELQLAATAEILDGPAAGEGGAALAAAHPGAPAPDPEQAMLVGLSVTWARWVDATVAPSVMEEHTF